MQNERITLKKTDSVVKQISSACIDMQNRVFKPMAHMAQPLNRILVVLHNADMDGARRFAKQLARELKAKDLNQSFCGENFEEKSGNL